MSDKVNSKGKAYNPTLAAMFEAPRFGLDATEDTPEDQVIEVVFQSGERRRKIIGTAFITSREGLKQKDFEEIQKNVQIGSGLLLRATSKLNAAGNRTYYLESLPNLNANEFKSVKNKSTQKPVEEDI